MNQREKSFSEQIDERREKRTNEFLNWGIFICLMFWVIIGISLLYFKLVGKL